MKNTNSYVPEDPGGIEWDVAVIGTGMGGAVAGYGLAKLGWRVLFIEKGRFLHDESWKARQPGADTETVAASAVASTLEHADARLGAGLWPSRLHGKTSFGDQAFFAPLGCGSGGSTSLYAAGLERFSPADFHPRANFPHVSDSTLPERWPIGYEDLQPFYRQAEDLFRVRGTPDPFATDADAIQRPPPALSARDEHICDSFARLGLHPYRVHVGFEFVEQCDECLGRRCPRQCKSDAARIALLPALQQYGAKMVPECEVLELKSEQTRVTEIRCRRDGKEISLRAKTVVLAAGAFMTPIILLNSRSAAWPDGLANRSGLVGRNLMLHASDYIAVVPSKRLSSAGPQKSLALNDFYHSGGEKLGTFQTVGAAVVPGQIMQYMRNVAERNPRWWNVPARPQPSWWRKLMSPAIRVAALLAYHLLNFKNASVWANIVEDLPYRENRVSPDPQSQNGMRFEYRYPAELRKRVLSFRTRLAKALGPHRMIVLSGDDNINYGHVCGTCRFGDDPETSVLDRNNRAHGVSNLYVVDASFFPSSGGTNPSLTIAANALRVTEVIHEQLR